MFWEKPHFAERRVTWEITRVQDGGQADEWHSANVHCSWKSYPFSPFRSFSWSGKNFLWFLSSLLYSQELYNSYFSLLIGFVARSEHSSILQRVQRTNKTHHNWNSDPHDHPLQGNFCMILVNVISAKLQNRRPST